TGFMSGSKRMSWLYIIGERRLREKAGTSWGSSPVASVVWAETKLPPVFGAWAKAGRPRLSAPRARPPARSGSRRAMRLVWSWSGWVVVIVQSPVAGLPAIGVEDVAQAVADQVEREHGDHDGDPGEHGDPRRRLEIRPSLIQHVAPRGRGRLSREAEVGKRGLDQDRLGQGHGALDHERRDHVG